MYTQCMNFTRKRFIFTRLRIDSTDNFLMCIVDKTIAFKLLIKTELQNFWCSL
jgi:hypothetical protein